MHVVQSTEIDLGLLKKALRINLALLKLKKGLYGVSAYLKLYLSKIQRAYFGNFFLQGSKPDYLKLSKLVLHTCF